MDETNTEKAQPAPHLTHSESLAMETKTIGISGMTCDECVKTIDRALRVKPGVKQVKVDRNNATATVSFDKRQTNLPELHEILLKSGYKPKGGVVE